MTKNNRKQYINRKRFQFKYTLIIIATVLITALVLVSSFYMDIMSGYPQMMEELFNLDKYLVRTAILAILALVSGIFITHKIIGPIFRIKKAFREISEGNYDVYINLRPADEFFDMGKEINELAAALKRRASSSDSKKKSS